MASRRTSVIVRRGLPPLSPATRQLLQQARQRQAWRSAMLLMGLLGIILATILSMTTTARIKNHDVATNKALQFRRLQGALADDNNKNKLQEVQEPQLRGAHTKNQTALLENSPVPVKNTTTVSNATSKETSHFSKA